MIDLSQELILNQTDEMFGISTIERTIPWMRTTLPHDRAIKLSKAKLHVYSDSVLCLGKIHERPWSMKHQKDKIGWFMNTLEYHELNGIDGELLEFEWYIFPGHTMLELLHEIHRKMAENRIRLEEFEDRIIFVSMHNDIDRTKDRNLQMCVSNSVDINAYTNRFPN